MSKKHSKKSEPADYNVKNLLRFLKPSKYHLAFLILIAGFIFLVSYKVSQEPFLFEDGIKHINWQDWQEPGPTTVNPDEVKGIYLTMWSASMKSRMGELLKLIDDTEINSVVIDVKGSQGELIYEEWSGIGDLIKQLHKKNIFVIARVVAFQDSGYAKEHPEFALKTAGGALWRDRRGFAWLDPASQGSWDHLVDVSRKAIDLGFDEIQFDYIRFPTDGNLSAIVYPAWDGQRPRSEALKEFFAYSTKKIKEYNPLIKTSIDIFGYTFLRSDDLGIGQLLPDAVEHFDYISPMVYPSHYSNGNFGFDNPADYPYEVIYKTIIEGLDSLAKQKLGLPAEALVEEGESASEDAIKEYLASVKPKIRPWIQVFDMGARYDGTKIKAQIKAVYDSGLTGWLMWDPNNRYTDVKAAIGGENE